MKFTATAFALLLLGATAVPAPAVPVPDKANDAAREARREAKALLKSLQEPVNFEKGLDAGTPFGGAGGAIDILNDRFNLNIRIDEKAFKQIDPEFNLLEQTVTVQKMAKVSMAAVLNILLDQVGNDRVAATYLVRKDQIVITTTAHANPANWGNNRRFLPRVSVDFDRERLDDALEEMSLQTGVSVVVDPRTAEKGRTPVTARLTNVALDTAVVVVTETADLDVVALEGVLFVTTREHAKDLRAREKERKAAAVEAEAMTPKPAEEKPADK